MTSRLFALVVWRMSKAHKGYDRMTTDLESIIESVVGDAPAADDATPAPVQPDNAAVEPTTPDAPTAPPSDDDELARMNQQEADLLARLESTLAPEDLEAFRKQFVGKSAFTRLRTKDREQVRSIESEKEQIRQQAAWALDQLRNVQQQPVVPQQQPQRATPQQQQASRIEEFIRAKGLDEYNPELAEFFREFGNVAATEAEQRAAQYTAPFIQEVHKQAHQQAAEAYKNQMIQKYGSGFDAYWGDLYEQTARSGFQVDPEILFLRNHELDALRMRQEVLSKTKSTKADPARLPALEGFSSTRGTRPPAPRRIPREVKDDGTIRPTEIALAALDDIDTARRRG